MRIWSLHPRYLDARGLVALWRETLLAQAVLLGRTKGYTRHPQLERFRAGADPAALVATYLEDVRREALARGYAFAADRIGPARTQAKLCVTEGQLAYEWRHLLAKLDRRDPPRAQALQAVRRPDPHPLFDVVPGEVEIWEKIASARRASPS
jgi:hypothetical protein